MYNLHRCIVGLQLQAEANTAFVAISIPALRPNPVSSAKGFRPLSLGERDEIGRV
jgi:hypothetical protein